MSNMTFNKKMFQSCSIPPMGLPKRFSPCRPKIPASLTALLGLSASNLEALLQKGELVQNNHLGCCLNPMVISVGDLLNINWISEPSTVELLRILTEKLI